VFLPPCYSDTDQSYPVVFLLHGFPFDERQWQEFGAFRLAEAAMHSDRWPDAILVLPRQPSPIFTQSDGGPNSYEREFLEGVIPLVENTFRLSGDDREWSIAGVSRGGVWALEIALRNPSIFGKIGAISPSLNVNYARNPYDPFWLVKNGPGFDGTIFVAVGEDDHSVRVTAEDFQTAMEEAGISSIFLLEPGSHNAAFWMSITEPILGFLIANER
jgi:predicted alpha/beta superfamily hydrolase